MCVRMRSECVKSVNTLLSKTPQSKHQKLISAIFKFVDDMIDLSLELYLFGYVGLLGKQEKFRTSAVVFVCACVCACVCAHACVPVRVCIQRRIHTNTRDTHTHTHTHIHAYVYIHIPIYTRAAYNIK